MESIGFKEIFPYVCHFLYGIRTHHVGTAFCDVNEILFRGKNNNIPCQLPDLLLQLAGILLYSLLRSRMTHFTSQSVFYIRCPIHH